MGRNIKLDPGIVEGYKESLKRKVYKLLPLREEKGEWKKFLGTILIELYGGLNDFESINYISLMLKLNALYFVSFYHYRKTILECMNLIDKLEF